MIVRLTLRAERDLQDIADHIKEQSPASAARVEAHLRSAFRLLSAHPEVGRSYRGNIHRFTLPRYPYLIFYDLDATVGELTILTVRHAKRRAY